MWIIGPRMGIIGPRMGIIGPRMWIIGPRMGIIGPRMWIIGPLDVNYWSPGCELLVPWWGQIWQEPLRILQYSLLTKKTPSVSISNIVPNLCKN